MNPVTPQRKIIGRMVAPKKSRRRGRLTSMSQRSASVCSAADTRSGNARSFDATKKNRAPPGETARLADQESVLAAILKNHPQLSREEALEALKEAGLSRTAEFAPRDRRPVGSASPPIADMRAT